MKKQLKLVCLLSFLVLIGLLLSGSKSFTVWKQVTDEFHQNLLKIDKTYLCKTYVEQNFYQAHAINSLEQVGLLQHRLKECKTEFSEPVIVPDTYQDLTTISHFIRLKLMQPIVFASAYAGISMHAVFSILCIVILLTLSFLHSQMSDAKNNLGFYLSLGIFSLVSITMNGRMLFGFLSFSFYLLLINLIQKKREIYTSREQNLLITYSVLMLLFSHISSGINFIAFILFVAALLQIYRSEKGKLMLRSHVLLILLFMTQLFLTLIGIVKNYLHFREFNSNSIVLAYLNHGINYFLNLPVYFLLLLFIVLSALLLYIYYVRLYLHFKNLKVMGFLLVFAGGFLGLSVLTNIIPFCVQFLLYYINTNTSLTFKNENLNV